MALRTHGLLAAVLTVALAIAAMAAGCAGAGGPGLGGVTAVPSTVIPSPDDLQPVTQPTLPAEVPGYLDVDPATGLHMTGTPTVVELATYRLKVTGRVEHELSLTYDEIRLLPKMTAAPELECPGYFLDTATWSGVPLTVVLDMAVVKAGASRVVFKAADGYSAGVDLAEAQAPDNFLAYELAGDTLPVLQGFPLRVVIPGLAGAKWVKWLVEIVVE